MLNEALIRISVHHCVPIHGCSIYHIAGNFRGVKTWQIAKFLAGW